MTAGTGTGERTVTSRDGTAIGYETVGQGDGVLVLGGAWRTARDYLRFARALADPFAVHLIDRRGRGRSGPQGASYSIEREIEDLIPDAAAEIIPGLDHVAPDEKAPDVVAARVREHLAG